MLEEENQNTEEITTEENPVSAEPKQEVVESVPVIEETQPIEQIENVETEIVEPIIEPAVETPIIETTETIEEIANQKIEEIPQAEILPVQEVPPQTTQTQEIPTKPQIKTVEKVIYQTPPNLIQNLLNKARAKIQERKRNKLDKIMSLFESNTEISNSNIQKLLRTTKRSATRYLNILEKEQKVTQVGNKGRGVKYIKKQ